MGGFAFCFFGMMGTQERPVLGVLGCVEAGNPFKNRHGPGLLHMLVSTLLLKGLA